MKIFVFDTETTWFINKNTTDLSVQPHIVQFAWIFWEIVNGEFIEIKRINQLIKPKINIPFQASQVHHIYDIDVTNAPSIEEKIDDFINIINEADLVIWHNIEYDEWVIWIELKRLSREFDYKPKQVFCTMKTTVDFCAIRGNWERFKYPKLWELYKKLFWEYFIWAHDAMVDVEATLKVFIELYTKNIIELEKKQAQKLSLF